MGVNKIWSVFSNLGPFRAQCLSTQNRHKRMGLILFSGYTMDRVHSNAYLEFKGCDAPQWLARI